MRAALVVLLLILPVLFAVVGSAQDARPEVLQMDITGVVTQGTKLHVESALAAAEERGIPLLIRLDTPGGLVDATLEIDKILANAEVPVMTFVGPRAGFAASAGTFILLMGQPSGMAPDTTIGSAQPINVAPDGSTQAAGDKIENFLVGRIQTIAERTGRNATLAAEFIIDNRNMNGTEAHRLGIVDVQANDVAAFLDAVHGMPARVGNSTVLLDTQDARITVHDRSLLSRVVDILGNPQISFLLILAGTYGLIFGLANPGTYVPEVIGAIFLILGFIGIGLFSASTAGIILLLLAVLLFIAEVLTPTHGFLTVAGAVAMLFAVLFLVRDEPLLGTSFLRTFFFAGVAAAVISGATVFGAVTIALRARDQPVHDALRGATGTVLEPVGASGRVTVHGEVWNARTAGDELAAGTAIQVTGRKGLILDVEPAPSTSEE